MKSTTLKRSSGLAALALTMSLGLAACGGEDETAADPGGETTSEAPAETPAETESDDMGGDMEESEDMGGDAAAGVFGAACDAVPASGDGSFDGMATAPVADAASANPVLETLVTAVGEAGLAGTLNSTDDLTVFAPTNDAFGKIPKKQLDAVLADKEQLTAILTHHVVPGRLAPEDLAGEHETLNGDMVMVEGEGEEFTVTPDNAAVVCGNVQTANATVYIIDTVLMPS